MMMIAMNMETLGFDYFFLSNVDGGGGGDNGYGLQ